MDDCFNLLQYLNEEDVFVTNPMILIGSNGCEFGLGKNERAKILRLGSVFCPLVDVDDVETRLVSVHGIQYDL